VWWAAGVRCAGCAFGPGVGEDGVPLAEAHPTTGRVRGVDAKSSLGDAKSSLGDAKSSLGDAKSSLGEVKSSLGDAKSSLGDAKSSLGGL
jgi:hypothetical protein